MLLEPGSYESAIPGSDKPDSQEVQLVDNILNHDELEEFSGKELLEKFKQSIIGHRIQVPTLAGTRPFINLDNSASTPTCTPIWDAFRKTLHLSDNARQQVISGVKSITAEMLGGPLSDFEIVFTSNTTEAINIVARSLQRGFMEGKEAVILNTIMEHSSNELPWRTVEGHQLIRLTVDREGFIDLDQLERLLDEYNKKAQHGNKRIRLVAISGASNVLGTCNNLEEISGIVHRYGAELLVDAAQLVAHRKVEMQKWNIDYLAFSAHKVYAPFGCGVLAVKKGLLNFEPEEMKLIQSSGEMNAGGIAALGKAFLLLDRIGMEHVQQEEEALTMWVLNGMSMIDGLKVHGVKTPDSPGFPMKLGVIVFELKGIMSNKVARELTRNHGIGVRYGCHCAHIIIKYLLNVSPGLEKFQRVIQTLLPKLNFPSLTRISLGIENSEEDIEYLIRALKEIVKWQGKTSRKTDFTSQINKFIHEKAARVYS